LYEPAAQDVAPTIVNRARESGLTVLTLVLPLGPSNAVAGPPLAEHAWASVAAASDAIVPVDGPEEAALLLTSISDILRDDQNRADDILRACRAMEGMGVAAVGFGLHERPRMALRTALREVSARSTSRRPPSRVLVTFTGSTAPMPDSIPTAIADLRRRVHPEAIVTAGYVVDPRIGTEFRTVLLVGGRGSADRAQAARARGSREASGVAWVGGAEAIAGPWCA
jgi:cell division GTPase FtsZ